MIARSTLLTACKRSASVANIFQIHGKIAGCRLASVNSEAKKRISAAFLAPDGKRYVGQSDVGDTLLDVVVKCNLPIDGFGICGGALACSTCHVILKKEDYDRIPNRPSDDEVDLLDMALGLTKTSRLACQIQLTEDLEGVEVSLPEGNLALKG
ncbi:hypothetical protein M514_04212 [Trichuris suis]|uniref:2Fe-2S ferredoxin-type domain-containing protein n=1 Tax=Trichuris suis TaxID=68888 RepID=A0A085NRN6_9BILA|nr:hypothetical protein M513_04212 [Trichuris suis]KFD72132.1 hypothetical protein M514_04212 [Trichuris suis]KHJ47611.1 2Fe-2S iron-sulfur cluster binding domain protein [Trichuris suis]